MPVTSKSKPSFSSCNPLSEKPLAKLFATMTAGGLRFPVALDRGARMVERFKLSGDWQSWRAAADEISAAILSEAWDERLDSLTEHLGDGSLDASLLSLPLRRVIPADHPKMVATTAARLSDSNGGSLGFPKRSSRRAGRRVSTPP